ncbi:MAG TPA: hypothetical protein VJ464_16730, partial [Blastocatellia bacterium]|nr:hypothetical protein [Blastocatellia bacterium]
MFKPHLSYPCLGAWGKRAMALYARLLTAGFKANSDRVFALAAPARRLLGLTVCLLLISGAAAAQTYPAPWPSSGSWIGYTQLGQAIQDKSTANNDLSTGGTGVNPDGIDVFNGTSGNLGSSYYYYDSTNHVFFFRLRLRGDPRGTGGNVMVQKTWCTLLDTDGDGYKEFFVEVNGNSTTIYVYYGDANEQDIPNGSSCASNGQGTVFSRAITLGSTGNVLVTDVTASGGGYLLDYQVPLTAFKDCSGAQAITPTTPFALAFTTSATTQNPTQKDFVGLGDFTMATTTPMPFSDIVTLSGTIEQKPRLSSYTKACGGGTNGSPVALTATTIDTLTVTGSGASATVIDTIASLTFSYRLNGTTTWTQINSPVTSPVTGTVNRWTTSWTTSSLPAGTYWIKIVIVDDQGNTTITTGYGIDLSNCGSVVAPSIVTRVDLADFKAERSADGRTLIEWQTGYEVSNLGFNLYRDLDGKRTRLNTSLIGGTALLGGEQAPFTAGFAYAWMDQLASTKDWPLYWLEDVDANGQSVMHGPVSPVDVSQLPAQSQSLMLSQLRSNAPGAVVENISVGSSTTQSRAARLSSASLNAQWGIAAKAGAKILIGKPGWYRITQPQLLAAGFDTSKDPRFLQLFTDAQEVPLIVSGGLGGRLEPTDFIEFYAQGLDTPSTNRRAYYLTNGALPGRRISVVSVGKGRETRNRSFTSTVERRDRFLYFPSINNGEAENWFGAIVSPTPFNQPISVAKLNQAASDDALLEVALQGLGSSTGPEHAVRLQLNGQEIGAMSFTGQQHQVAQFHISQRMLQEGNNQLTFTSQGGSDFSVIDSVKLSYAHRFVADQNSLLLSAAGGEMVQVTGF